jgi:hypothetical protein
VDVVLAFGAYEEYGGGNVKSTVVVIVGLGDGKGATLADIDVVVLAVVVIEVVGGANVDLGSVHRLGGEVVVKAGVGGADEAEVANATVLVELAKVEGDRGGVGCGGGDDEGGSEFHVGGMKMLAGMLK